MDRDLLLEIGCEELPASWLPPLTEQLGERLAARLEEHRLPPGAPVETFSTPRRLAAKIERLAERQTDFEETITGPPLSAAYGPDGGATPAAVGFARKHGVEVEGLTRVETPKGPYLAFLRKHRSRAAVDVLPQVLAEVLRDLSFPKNMRWDAWLEDGRGELLFGRPIRWLVFLYGGRVVPFTILRTESAESPRVQEVRSGAVTYGHRFLATSGRAGRAIKVRSFDDYRHRLAEHFVVLERQERHDRIARELDAHAHRLGGRVAPSARVDATLLNEVPDLVEYPSVFAGTFATEFLDLPEEVLTTTMIHHQHFFPVVDEHERLLPAFLAVTNTQADQARTIARNAERVLTARLRDAQFFWHADRAQPLEDRLPRLDTVLFHAKLGSYRAKTDRLVALAGHLAAEVLRRPEEEEHARQAARLAKTDLTTDMVREFTELQGTMGGIYAREEGQPEQVWKAMYYQYLPVAVEQDAAPSAGALGSAALAWAALALADKADTVAGLFSSGEEPTGSRDPFGLRRQAHGILRILADLPELCGSNEPVSLRAVVGKAWEAFEAGPPSGALRAFFRDRLRHLFDRRGYRHAEINAVFGAEPASVLRPLDVRRRLEALRQVRTSENFEALAVLFKRVKNIARELAAPVAGDAWRARLTEEAERALLDELDARTTAIEEATATGHYARAFLACAEFRPAVDRFFNEVFVMVDDAAVREARLALMVRLRDLVLGLADISEISPADEQSAPRGAKE